MSSLSTMAVTNLARETYEVTDAVSVVTRPQQCICIYGSKGYAVGCCCCHSQILLFKNTFSLLLKYLQ